MPTDFNPYDPRYSQYQAAALTSANQNIVSKANQASMLATALGPQSSSGAFGNLPPEALFGLSPEQVSSVAKDKSTQALQSMMTNMHALDFVRKATGTDQAEELEKLRLRESTTQDIAAMQEAARLAQEKIRAKADKRYNTETVDHYKFEANKAFDAWLGNPSKSAKPSKNQILSTDYGKRLQEARAFRSYLGTKAEMLKQGNMSPEITNLLTGLGMTGKQAIIELQLSDEADRIFGDEVTPHTKKPVATDPAGKTVYEQSGKYVYEDGTEYKPKGK
jgi:hypothetical protein